MHLKGVREIKDKDYFDAQHNELKELLAKERNEYEQLKDNLYDLWSQLESNKIELDLAVEAVGSIYRYYKAKEIIK